MFQLLLSFLSLLSLAAAAPITTQQNAWHYGVGGGIIGFIVLVLDCIAFLEIIQSNRPVLNKVLFCLGIFLFPIGGIIIYYLFADRAGSRSGGYEPISS